MGEKDKDSAVKIDSHLLNRVEEFIKKEENRFKFVNKKHFIDLAVLEFLEKNKKDGKNKNEKKD